ncbi:MAG: DapH/DapD/GlmU-related protein, partial [Kiloniellales bacterium]|nr:DapH/DapD/GlmU-related protein [Kiloniellales bacterium]
IPIISEAGVGYSIMEGYRLPPIMFTREEASSFVAAEKLMQQRLRQAAMISGVTLVDPETVWMSVDTQIASDVVIEPNVYIGKGVKIAEGATIKSFSYLEGASVGPGCTVGPFARLRPGTRLEKGAKIGNFVELKNAVFGEGAKANHLTYVGDTTVGRRANIGAGTITCNYDGFSKYRCEIGEGAFIGSNTALVAPVSIGDGALVGAGSTITHSVEPDALAVARNSQRNIKKGAEKFRSKQLNMKKVK